MVNQLGCLRVSWIVFTTFDRAFIISSFELNLAYISVRSYPKLSLKSFRVLLWNSDWGYKYINWTSFGRPVRD